MPLTTAYLQAYIFSVKHHFSLSTFWHFTNRIIIIIIIIIIIMYFNKFLMLLSFWVPDKLIISMV